MCSRAELEEGHALLRPPGVPSRPVVELPRVGDLLGAVVVAQVQRAGQDVAPVGALAQVTGKALEQRGELDTGWKVEVADELVAPVEDEGPSRQHLCPSS